MHGMANDMAMPSMSASGQAPSLIALAESACLSAPCCTVSTLSAQQLGAPVKFSLTGVLSFMPVDRFPCVAAPVRAGPVTVEAVSPSLDRHVLFQVFRI